jgi:hypothetical protein
MNKLPKWATTVTPLSKTVALIIFTSFPVFAFIFGMKYQLTLTPFVPAYQPAFIIRDVNRTDTEAALIVRCGSFDKKPVPTASRSQVVRGPAWAPDCRHIAWSAWQTLSIPLSATGKIIPITPPAASDKEGVYILEDSSNKPKRIYSPKKANESPTFMRWINRNNILFSAGGKKFKYNLVTDTTQPE